MYGNATEMTWAHAWGGAGSSISCFLAMCPPQVQPAALMMGREEQSRVTPQKIISEEETIGVGLPDLANKNIGCPITFEFQTDNNL